MCHYCLRYPVNMRDLARITVPKMGGKLFGDLYAIGTAE